MDFENAEQNYKEALKIDENDLYSNYNMGVLQLELQNSQASLKYFNKALEIAKQQNYSAFTINILINISLIYER